MNQMARDCSGAIYGWFPGSRSTIKCRDSLASAPPPITAKSGKMHERWRADGSDLPAIVTVIALGHVHVEMIAVGPIGFRSEDGAENCAGARVSIA